MLFSTFLALFLLLVLLLIFFTIIDGPQHPAMYVIFIFFMITPCVVVMLWAKLFKIVVSGEKITIRKGTGVTYSIYISEIVQVDQKIVYNKWGRTETITVSTTSRRFSIESFMEGFDKMSSYLLENVDNSKINTTTKS